MKGFKENQVPSIHPKEDIVDNGPEMNTTCRMLFCSSVMPFPLTTEPAVVSLQANTHSDLVTWD